MLLQGERDLAVSLHVGHETRQKKNKFLACKTAEICERRSDHYSWECLSCAVAKNVKFLNRLSWVTRKNLQPSHLNPADLKLIKWKRRFLYSAFLQAMRAAEEQKAREEEQRRWVLHLTSLVLIGNMHFHNFDKQVTWVIVTKQVRGLHLMASTDFS